MCARVLVDRVVHLVVVRKIARAARKAVHMNVGHRLPGLLSVLHSTCQVTPASTERAMPALLWLLGANAAFMCALRQMAGCKRRLAARGGWMELRQLTDARAPT